MCSFNPLPALSLGEVLSWGPPLLIDSAAKGAVLLAAAWVVTAAMRKASAAARHVVWLLAVLSLPLLPALSAVLPQWRVLPSWAALRGQAARVGVATPMVARGGDPPADAARTSEPLSPAGTGAGKTEPVAGAASLAMTTTGSSETAGGAAAGSGSRSPYADARPVSLCVLAVWLAGACAASLPLLIGAFLLRRVGRGAARVRDAAWAALLGRARRDLGVRREVLLLRSSRSAMPMVWGLVRPRVLLPADADGWDAARRRMVLLHELSHVKRWDCLWQLLVQLVCALYWFNPLLWIAARTMRGERERACDDLVLAAGGAPRCDYAEQLLQVASKLRPPPVLGAAAIAMARPSQLESRLLAILDPERNRRRLTRTGVAVATLLVTASVVACAALAAADRDAAAKAPAAATRPAAPTTRPAGALEVALPDGGALRLLALGSPQATPPRWWAPDGSPVAADPQWNRFRQEAPNQLVGVVEVVHPGATPPSAAIGPDGSQHVIPWVTNVLIYTPRQFSVGVGVGPWKTLGEMKAAPGQESGLFAGLKGGKFEAKLEEIRPNPAGGSVRGWYTLIPDMEVAWVAVTRDGEEKDLAPIWGVTTYRPPNYETKHQLNQPTHIRGIDRIRVKVRPRHWVRFDSIAGDLGDRTEPRGAVEPAGAAAARPAASFTEPRPAAEAFIAAIARGELDAAFDLTTSAYRQAHPKEGFTKGFARMREAVDLATLTVTDASASADRAAAVTTFARERQGGRQVALGLGLIREGEKWLVRDVDMLGQPQAAEKFLAEYRRADPAGREVPATQPATTRPAP